MQNETILSHETKRNLFLAGIIGIFIVACGLFFAPERLWSNLFIATFYLLTIGLGGTLFLALTFVTGAGWHVAFRRVPEAMARIVPFAGAATLAVLWTRIRLYGWPQDDHAVAGTFWFKEFWLTPWFWGLRSVGYIVAWSLFGEWLTSRSRQQDTDNSGGSRLAGNVRLSALFLVVHAITFSLASVDWIMALEPLWFSTMWGVYNFAGMILATLAATIILCVRLSRPGCPLHGAFNSEHLHDLGKLLIGFSCFWAYIWFSQYMLIWYANIPEETSYFLLRTDGAWGPVVVAAIAFNWIIPFFILLPKSAKRSPDVMLRIAIVVLVGRWVDLYLMVFPAILGRTPVFGFWEVVIAGCATTIGVVLVKSSFKRANPVPQNDEHLSESLHYHA